MADGTFDGRFNYRSEHDLLTRMIAAAVFTLALTGLASTLGARPAGLIGALPLLTIVIAVATHRREGTPAVEEFLHGVMAGSFSVVAALTVLTMTVGSVALPVAFAGAIIASFLAQLIPTPGRRSRTTTLPASLERNQMVGYRTISDLGRIAHLALNR